MVSLSNNTQGNVNITTRNGAGVNLTSNNDTDVNANMNGNAQRAKSWAVGEGLIDGVDYSAKHYAQDAKESAEQASGGVEAITEAKEQALSAIDTEKTEAIADMETAKDEKIGEIEQTAADFEDDLEALTTRAETAATNAETSETNAATSATSASTSATNASNSATSAATNANLALGYKNDAYTYANNAAQAKTTAETAASNAEFYWTQTYTAAGQASNSATSARQSASTAQQAKTTAENAASAAGNYAQQAEQAKEDIEAELDNYVQTSELTTVLADYVLSSDLSTTLADYATQQWAQTNANALYSAMKNWVNNQGFALSSNLASVATSGSYNDLSNKPTIPDAQVQADWDVTDTTSKAYIKNKPYIPSGVVIDQTYDGTSTNAQSGVAIAGAKFLQNLVTSNTAYNSLTIKGIAATEDYAVNIGGNSQAGVQSVSLGHNANATSYSCSVGKNANTLWGSNAFGRKAEATGNYSNAFGFEAKATGKSAIQIGYGTNSTDNTLSVGFYGDIGSTTHYNWQLLDGTTGLIPDARISSNFVTNSSLATTLSDYATQQWVQTNANTLYSTIQTWVQNQGYTTNVGTVTSVNNTQPDNNGNVTITIPTNYVQATNGNTAYTNTGTEATMGYTDTSTYEMYGVLTGYTTYGTGVILGAQSSTGGYLTSVTVNGLGLTNGATMQTALLTVSNNNLAVNGTEVVTGDNTRFDGQWVQSFLDLVTSAITLSSNYSNGWDISSYLPNDNYIYEVYVTAYGVTDAKSGSLTDVRVGSSILKANNTTNTATAFVLRSSVRSNANRQVANTIVIPVGTDRQLTVRSYGTGTLNTLRLLAYRRVGTNT